jgi:hypothetical protein
MSCTMAAPMARAAPVSRAGFRKNVCGQRVVAR